MCEAFVCIIMGVWCVTFCFVQLLASSPMTLQAWELTDFWASRDLGA